MEASSFSGIPSPVSSTLIRTTIQAKGTHAMLIFFALNGIELRYTQKELYAMVLAVADGSLEYDAMLKWILEHQA